MNRRAQYIRFMRSLGYSTADLRNFSFRTVDGLIRIYPGSAEAKRRVPEGGAISYPVFAVPANIGVPINDQQELHPIRKDELVNYVTSVQFVLDLQSMDELLTTEHFDEASAFGTTITFIKTFHARHVYLLRRRYWVDVPGPLDVVSSYGSRDVGAAAEFERKSAPGRQYSSAVEGDVRVRRDWIRLN